MMALRLRVEWRLTVCAASQYDRAGHVALPSQPLRAAMAAGLGTVASHGPHSPSSDIPHLVQTVAVECEVMSVLTPRQPFYDRHGVSP
jgi:hypothetical protein